MYILQATLLELELTDTLENIGGQIYRLAAEPDITVHLIKQKKDGTQFLCRRRQ